MMELYISITKGFKPDLLQRLFGLKEDNQFTSTTLFLTDPKPRTLLPNEELAKVFSIIIRKIADAQPIRLLFSDDKKEIRKKLLHLNIELEETKTLLWIELDSHQQSSSLKEIMQSVAFTTFYAQIPAKQDVPHDETELLSSISKNDAIIVFSLFDEHIEIISEIIAPEIFIDMTREVCKELNIQLKE